VKKVSALDLSITAPGVAHTVEGAVCTHLIKPREKGDLRLSEIAGAVIGYAEDSDFVLIEGYLNQSMSAGITGMVHGAVRAALIENGLTYATLPPSSLKKFATGRGGASKTDMAVAAFKRGGVEFTNDNECDAWWLWVAAMDYAGQPVFDLPKIQRDALSKIKVEA
jgi:Holliday junction resolvasome RuvABC endonuclease subunit